MLVEDIDAPVSKTPKKRLVTRMNGMINPGKQALPVIVYRKAIIHIQMI
jgi:hypothetical protein